MKRQALLNSFAAMLMLFTSQLYAQLSINTDQSPPDNSAMLDVKSASKGFLPPRMTHTELSAISNPANGLVVFCIDCGSTGLGSLCMFMAGDWVTLSSNCLNPLSPVAGTQIPSLTQIIWNWNTVPWATGYKWNTINDYASATDMGMAKTKTETGLTGNTAYTRYAWAYSACGNSAPVTLTSQTIPFSIGQTYGGGIIFYIDGTGQHGLIAAPSDQSTGAEWGCYGTSIPGTSTAIGTGQANTTAIVTHCGTLGIAAQIFDALVLNGYSDWFLPSKDELNQMYSQKNVIGGFADFSYFSSSEYDAYHAWNQYFFNGHQDNYYYDKNGTLDVRAVRAF